MALGWRPRKRGARNMADDCTPRGFDRLAPPDGYDGKMERMARLLNVDLREAMARTDITETGIRLMMSRCASCGDDLECAAWMKRQGAHAPEPFPHCPNQKAFDELRARAHDRLVHPKRKTPPEWGGVFDALGWSVRTRGPRISS